MTSINQTTTYTTTTRTAEEKKQVRHERTQKWFAGLGIAFKGLGDTAMQAGLTSAVIKDMNRGGCCGGGSIFGGFGFGGFGNAFGRFGFGGGCCNPTGYGMFNTGMMMNQYNYAQGMMAAHQYGTQIGLQALQMATGGNLQSQQVQLSASKTDAKYAGDIDKNQETKTGADFNKATDEMTTKNGEAIDGKSFTFSTPKNADEYKNDISNLAKSYLMDSDKGVGNGDGKLTKEEFIKKEMAKLDKNASADKKAQARAASEVAFDKVDMNGDGYADWKELAATIATFGTDTTAESDEKTLDGKIDSKDFAHYSSLMGELGVNDFDKTIRSKYTQLFGENE